MIEVTLHSLQNAKAAGQQLANAAIPILKGIVNDARFRDAIRATEFSYSARMNEAGAHVRSTSNTDILELIAGGKEVKAVADGVIDLHVTLYRSNFFLRNTMGYVTIPDPMIHTNTRHFDRWVNKGHSLSLAAHWMHEWMHVAGFYHADSDGDSNDVAYGVGQHAIAVGRLLAQEQQAFFPNYTLDMGQSYLDVAKEMACPCRKTL